MVASAALKSLTPIRVLVLVLVAQALLLVSTAHAASHLEAAEDTLRAKLEAVLGETHTAPVPKISGPTPAQCKKNDSPACHGATPAGTYYPLGAGLEWNTPCPKTSPCTKTVNKCKNLDAQVGGNNLCELALQYSLTSPNGFYNCLCHSCTTSATADCGDYIAQCEASAYNGHVGVVRQAPLEGGFAELACSWP